MKRPAGERPIDDAVRRRASEEIGRSFLVEAGAGTGKTTLLVKRVLHLVARGNAQLDRIVAITFTEKAAAELRVRLREALERAAAGDDGGERDGDDWTPEERCGFADALALLPLANISTIHAFAATLLRERPVEAGIDPGFTQLDGVAAAALLDDVWSRWETSQLASGAAPYRRVLAGGISRDAVRRLAIELVGHRSLSMAATRGGDGDAERGGAGAPHGGAPPDLDALADALARGVREPESLVSSSCRAPDEDKMAALVRAAAESIRAFAAADPDERESLFASLDVGNPAGKGNKQNWRPEEALADAREKIGALRALVQEAAMRATVGIALWLRGFVDAYAAAKRARGELDFDDLLILARDLLRGRPDVRGEFLEQFDAILVDEFQDTDPLQTAILMFLAEKTPAASRWEDVAVAPGRLFVVGDPKQSIYRFRRADIDVYAEVRERFETDARLRITQNFRSVPGIVDWTNGLFERLFAPSAKTQSQAEFAPIAAQRGPKRDAPAVLLLAPPPGAEATLSADAAREAEAAAIAATIGDAIAERRVSARDVAILFRVIKGITPYEDALESRGVPFQVEGGKAYYEREEVQALLACLLAIDDPEDPIALVASLRSPFFGVSDDALALLAADEKRFRYLNDPGAAHAALADAFAVLRTLHARRKERPIHRIVENLFDETRVLEHHALRGGGRRAVANLHRVAEKARRFVALGPATLRGFVRWLEQEAGEAAEGDSPIADPRDDLVTLMTIHKAKGLEFPVVALANLHGGGGFRDSFLVEGRAGRFAFSLGGTKSLWKSPGFDEVREREVQRHREEERRVLYVAATRAKDLLVLSGHAALLKRKNAGLFADLASGLGPRDAWRDGAVIGGVTVKVVAPAEGRGAGAQRAAHAGASGGPRAFTAEADWDAGRRAVIARASAPLEIVTSRRLHPSERHVSTGEGRGFGGADPHAGDDAAAAKTALGGFVHRVLERLPASDDRALLEAVTEIAARDGFDGDRDAALALVRGALAQPVVARARLAPRALREVPFGARLESGRLAEGVIDLVFEDDGALVIVDYKTDRLEGRAPHDRARCEAHARARGHLDQMALYAQAAHAATGLPVREAVLVYAAAGAELSLDGASLLAHELPDPFPVVEDGAIEGAGGAAAS